MSSVTTSSGGTVSYDILVVAAGIQINWDAISGGLPEALADPSSGVSSIYSYDTCDKTWHDIDAMRTGKAIFTQPAGPVKCAGGNLLMLDGQTLFLILLHSTAENYVDGVGPLSKNR
jgi:hypothetical protein